MNTLTDFEKPAIAVGIAMPGAMLISVSLKSDILSLFIGFIGILLLSFGSILKGGVKE